MFLLINQIFELVAYTNSKNPEKPLKWQSDKALYSTVANDSVGKSVKAQISLLRCSVYALHTHMTEERVSAK